jgi:lipoyl(octanoyl) transferase
MEGGARPVAGTGVGAAPGSGSGGPPCPVVVRPWQHWGYREAVEAMRRFTLTRDTATADEVWLVEHPPVFTLGHAARPEHVLAPGDIPVVQAERGGEVTYHGPGQVLAYTLVDLHRRRLKVHAFVTLLEQAVIEVLDGFGVRAVRREAAPGVYVSTGSGAPGAKIASVGIRVSQGRVWHGLALNVAMDLEPFSRINPCGYPGLAVTDLRNEAGSASPSRVAGQLGATLAHLLGSSQ